DARAPDNAAGHGKTVKLGLAVELFPEHAAFDDRRPLPRIDVDTLHQGEVDHQGAVGHRAAANVVAASAHRDLQPLGAGVAHRVRDVGDATATRDDSGPF